MRDLRASENVAERTRRPESLGRTPQYPEPGLPREHAYSLGVDPVGARAVADPPSSLGDIGLRVAAAVDAVLADELERWSATDPMLAAPLASLRTFVASGGKRLRPAFCHWAYVGAGGAPDDGRVLGAEASLELLHTFALVHDDVMDGSDIRRGIPAVHADYEARHRAHAWRGESRRFGTAVAILVGDLAFVYADRFLRGAPPAVHDVFDEMRLELCAGQSLDVLGAAEGELDEVESRRIAWYKSAKYSVERPLHIGAVLAARPDLVPRLSAYGLAVGEAFQLRDDLLGVFGDAAVLGKPVGDDLRTGKPTPLVARARDHADAAQTAVLSRLGDPTLDETDLDRIRTVLVDTGARAAIEERIDALVDGALDVLGRTPLAEPAVDELDALARFVAYRDR